MLSQLSSNKKVVGLLQNQLKHTLLLKSNFTPNGIKNSSLNRIQLRFFNNGSNNDDNKNITIKASDENKNDSIESKENNEMIFDSTEVESNFDEDIDNPKPLPFFENIKKEAEKKKKINERIYQFPNNPEKIFSNTKMKTIGMKDILYNDLPTKSFDSRLIKYEENKINLDSLPYIYNQNTLTEIQLLCEGLLNPSIKTNVRNIPSQNSRLLLLSCPIKGSDIYLKNIALHTAKKIKANFLEISNEDLFHRISGNVMKAMPFIETEEMLKKRNANNEPKERRAEPPINNVFSMFNEKRTVYDKGNGTKVPYPIFRNYEDAKGNPMVLLNKFSPWPRKDIELNRFIQETWLELYPQFNKISNDKPLIVFYDDLLSLFNNSMDKQDIYDGLTSIADIWSMIRNQDILIIAPSTPTFQKKLEKPNNNNNRFGPIFDETSQGFRAPDIDAEKPAPKNRMFDEGKDKVETNPIEFNTILDSFVGVTVVPVFPSFQKDADFKKFRSVIDKDYRKLLRQYNLRELDIAAKAAHCIIPKEELERLESPGHGMYLEEKMLTPSEIERLLLISMAKVKEPKKELEITKLAVTDIQKADNILLSSLQSQQYLKDGLEYISLFKNPKDRFTLNKYENRILKECLVLPSNIKTTYNSIGGLKKTKEIMNELISLPLKRPDLFKTGILKEVTTGILLFGPPGTGKTLSARAVAAQSGANFLNIQMSNIQSKWVGENEKNVKAIFSLSRKLAPCVLFIDEIDALLQTRKGEFTPHYMVNTLNEFMQEWDGLVSENEGVIVIGATNRPFDLDEAVLRRLPRRIFVSLPDKESRKEILDILLKDEVVGKTKEERNSILEHVAEITKQWSGSDLKNLCIATALNAIKLQIIDKHKENDVNRVIEKEHFDMAIESGDIVPSLNEKTSILIQLQEWNSKYGTGADAGGYCGHSTVFGF